MTGGDFQGFPLPRIQGVEGLHNAEAATANGDKFNPLLIQLTQLFIGGELTVKDEIS